MSEAEGMNAMLRSAERALELRPEPVTPDQVKRYVDLMERLTRAGTDILNDISQEKKRVADLEGRLNKLVKEEDDGNPHFS